MARTAKWMLFLVVALVLNGAQSQNDPYNNAQPDIPIQTARLSDGNGQPIQSNGMEIYDASGKTPVGKIEPNNQINYYPGHDGLDQLTKTENTYNSLQFVSRHDWMGRSPKDLPQPMPTPVQHIFIHHTFIPDQCFYAKQCQRAVQGIQDFHMDTRGWNDIGYNFLLGGDGHIYEGRGWYSVGAHTYGMNSKSVALSIIGNYTSVSPPQRLLDLAKKWIDYAVAIGVVTPVYQLHGHRDQTCTESPGQTLYDIIKTWRYFKEGPLDTYICRNKT